MGRRIAWAVEVIRGDFEMAEVMWEAAEPCLSEEQRLAALTALHVGEPSQALLVVVTALSRSGHPLPSALHVEFQEWLRRRPGSGSPADWTLLEIRVAAADVRATADVGMIDGRYGEATLCYFVLDDAGVVDASREHQAAALRKWLSANRPSPPLRTDMRLNGFGYLLDDPHPPSCDGLDTP
uniref:Uncharacterized protein n=2 Tax=Mycobacteriaceae TaxID=1762 RepID=A4TGA9_MYCGI